MKIDLTTVEISRGKFVIRMNLGGVFLDSAPMSKETACNVLVYCLRNLGLDA